MCVLIMFVCIGDYCIHPPGHPGSSRWGTPNTHAHTHTAGEEGGGEKEREKARDRKRTRDRWYPRVGSDGKRLGPGSTLSLWASSSPDETEQARLHTC